MTAPIRLTVTTSPRHGVDHSLDHAVRLRRLGHAVTLHVAARMIRGSTHLAEILERAAEAGIDDLLVIGGDAARPLGPYESAGELLEVLAVHPLRPAAVGIGGYPEGHPLIEQDALDAALQHKAPLASYIVTQLCFDPDVLLSWLERLRARGIELPVYIGAPGPIDRRRLLDISLRIGVGPSLRFVRKQRGLTQLFRSPVDSAARLYDAIAPRLNDPRWGMSTFHFFTFNELQSTWRWQRDRAARLVAASEHREVDARG
jgi:methylenetetrahydrofolate reductase (NADPH)